MGVSFTFVSQVWLDWLDQQKVQLIFNTVTNAWRQNTHHLKVWINNDAIPFLTIENESNSLHNSALNRVHCPISVRTQRVHFFIGASQNKQPPTNFVKMLLKFC